VLCTILKTHVPSAMYSTFRYPVTLKPGLGSLKVIENYFSRSGTHDFLLTFHCSQRPISHRLRVKRLFQSKVAKFSYPRVYIAPMKGFPWNLVSAQGVPNASMMGQPDARKSSKIGLVVLIQYRL